VIGLTEYETGENYKRVRFGNKKTEMFQVADFPLQRLDLFV